MRREADARHYRALWRRAKNLPGLQHLSPALIKDWAEQRGLQVVSVEAAEVGAFSKSSSVILTTPTGQACFPKVPLAGDHHWVARHRAALHRAALWSKVEWFEPPWVPHGRADAMLKDIEHCSKKQAIQHFDYHTSTIYTIPFQAVCIGQVLPAGKSLVDFCPLVREAFLAFYGGHRASSIAALIPIIEGSLTRILSGTPGVYNLTTPDKVDRAVDGAIALAALLHFEDMWVPSGYDSVDYLLGEDDRVFMFETFRRWLKESFYRKTDHYDGVTWLNRHLFAHGASASWSQIANFRRLLVAIATLALVESWHDNSNVVSLMLPEMNDDSRLLWQRALFEAEAQGILKELAAKRYHEHGRLVPEFPTDDGATLRKALLAQDCINDLVRPLRDAGWSVEVDDPEPAGLYVTVHASAGERDFHVALLFSCATANDTYRLLAETCSAILYRGAPYHQDSYAYGVGVHVGPVAGWQPPTAS